MTYMSLQAFVFVTVIAAIALLVMAFVLRKMLCIGTQGYIATFIVAWLGAWLGTAVYGFWAPSWTGPQGYRLAFIPAFIGAIFLPYLLISICECCCRGRHDPRG